MVSMENPDKDYEPEDRIWKKLIRREDSIVRDQQLLRKISDEYETLEEVFDKRTLLTLYKMLNEGILARLHGTVASGKEARVYGAEDLEGRPLAVKIYLTATAEFKKGRMKYIMGDPRFEGVGGKTADIIYAWASKEFKNLSRAWEGGVNVPRPIHQDKNILVMEFIGRDFTPAPTLRERDGLTEWIYRQVMRQVKILYSRADLIHADLSEFNIFYFNRRPILFDLAQGVLKGHPQADNFLRRDVENITRFFKRKRVETISVDEALDWIRS